MSTATLSTKGQLVIPGRLRKALNLQAGDEISLRREGQKLILERTNSGRARLVRGKFGRPVLTVAKGGPRITTEMVNAILQEMP